MKPDQQSQTFECVEIYVPKKLEHLSELYTFLSNKLDRAPGDEPAVAINGFSLYEVDGAFLGDRVYQERTVVIRILLQRGAQDDGDTIRSRIRDLGREVAETVAFAEDELWICHYPLGVVIFRPREPQRSPRT
jgi:hypothetical protein